MTRKHFEAVARNIAAEYADAMLTSEAAMNEGDHIKSAFQSGRAYAIGKMARDMADMFAAANPRFDRSRFLSACKVGE